MAAAIPWASHKNCKFAIGLQTARDVAATSFYLIPTGTEEQELDLDHDYSFFQYGSGYQGLTHSETKGTKIEGKIALPLVPGFTGTGDLYKWIFERAAEPYRQGGYATIIKAIGDPAASNYLIEQYINCKVKSGTISVDFGADYAKMSCNVQGNSLPTTVTFPSGAGINTALMTTTPYRYAEASVKLDPGTDSLAAEPYTTNHLLEFDNKLEVLNLLNETTLPTDLPNTEWADWKGSFDRPFVDTTIRAAFIAGREVQYQLLLTRGGTQATFTMERIKYTKAAANPGTSGVVWQKGINFQALCPLDDPTVMACEIEESVGS